jgi:hypothetical protein
MFPGAPVSADGKTMLVDGSLLVSFHVVQRNPLQLLLRTDHVTPPPANWWQS